jgi:serine/threonine protein kinase
MAGGSDNLDLRVQSILDLVPSEERERLLSKLTRLLKRTLSKNETLVLAKGNPGNTHLRFQGLKSTNANNFYVIQSKLGEGGMGIVYDAFDVQLERRVALKVLKQKDEEMFERFMRERRITAELDHPNFVRILTTGYLEVDGKNLPFYTMPLIKGDNLNNLIEERLLPTSKGEKLRAEFTQLRLLQIVQQICQAMQSAHDKRIIHRDLKPSNIIIGPYGETYVMDLGLAKKLNLDEIESGRLLRILEQKNNQRDKDLTLDTGIGTPYYMAPEQIVTPQKVDHRADIFGIGAILYHVLTGQRPKYVARTDFSSVKTVDSITELVFSSIANECRIIPPSKVIAEQRDQIKKRVEYDLPAKADSVDGALEAICMKALRRNPDDRYSSCKELWQELQQFIEGCPELILEREGKELTKVMTKENLDDALESFELAEQRANEAIKKLEGMGRAAFEEKLKMIDLQIGKSRIYHQRGQSIETINTVENAKKLIEAPLNAAQKQYIRLLIMEGLAEFSLKNYGAAKIRQLKAIEMSKIHPEKRLLVSAYHNYGLACTYEFAKNRNLADFNEGRVALINCYKLADNIGDIQSSVHARALLSSLLMEKRECLDDAKTVLEQALSAAGEDKSLLAEINTNLCTYFYKSGSYDGAIKHGELAVKLAIESDAQVYLHESRLLLGKSYHFSGKPEKRRENLKELLAFDYPREPSFKDEISDFYSKNKLDIAELI